VFESARLKSSSMAALTAAGARPHSLPSPALASRASMATIITLSKACFKSQVDKDGCGCSCEAAPHGRRCY
jgi:hypothetical protein